MYLKKIILFFFALSFCFASSAQQTSIHNYLNDDTLLKRKWSQQIMQVKQEWIDHSNTALKKDYQSIYDTHFSQIENIANSKTSITAAGPYNYLQQILSVILKANPQFKKEEIRLFFSRDWWANASSLGDGTIVINAGLVIHLQNEAELAFVICHELAHYCKKHIPAAIDNYVTQVTSSDFQKKLQTLSKQEYGVNRELEKMARNLVFNSRYHSRTKELEADQEAFTYFVNTGYNCSSIISLLHTLDTIDQAKTFPDVDIQKLLNFESYPFKRKWIQNESAIFSQMGSNAADEKMKDTLKTHPDCSKRIAVLSDSVKKQKTGSDFIVNETYFKQLKQDLFTEMIEYSYQSGNICLNLYYNLQLLQQQQQIPLASWAIARDLNKIYELQKKHTAGLALENEAKGLPEDYNLLLRLLNRIRLDELQQLTKAFCTKYLSPFTQYKEITEEIKTANKNSY